MRIRLTPVTTTILEKEGVKMLKEFYDSFSHREGK